jgi:thiamine pyrophosphate-dependent acetolactate synthase large subunit-like protein
VFPEDHALFVGVRGDHTVGYLTSSDLILAVGFSLSPSRFSHGIPGAANKTIINLNVSELDVNKVYQTSLALIGDAKFALQVLTEELSKQTEGKGKSEDGIAMEVKSARDRGWYHTGRRCCQVIHLSTRIASRAR